MPDFILLQSIILVHTKLDKYIVPTWMRLEYVTISFVTKPYKVRMV